MKSLISFINSVLIGTLIILLTIYCIPQFSFAKEGTSLSNAILIVPGESQSIAIPAYDSVYFYFSVTEQYNAKSPFLSAKCHNAVSVSLLSDSGDNLKVIEKSSSSKTFFYTKKLRLNKRYFLLFHNKTTKESKVTLTLLNIKSSTKESKMSKADHTTKPCTTSKAAKSSKAPDRTKLSGTSKAAKSLNAADRTKPSSTSKAAKSSNAADRTKPSGTSKAAKSLNAADRTKPSGTSKAAKSSNAANATENNNSPPTPSGNLLANLDLQETTAPFPKKFSIKHHFLKVKKGFSVALLEKLELSDQAEHSITISNTKPDLAEISSNILYAKQSGILQITLSNQSYKTYCTVMIIE